MVAVLNPNNSELSYSNALLAPRNLGRGSTLLSSGATSTVTWVAGQVQVDGVNKFALASEPIVLDYAADSLDREQVVWKSVSGEVFIRFYDPILVGFNSLNIGTVGEPAICNDFQLYGSNTVVVYLVGGNVHYRLQSDRYLVDYTLSAVTIPSISRFGAQVATNSLAVLKI